MRTTARPCGPIIDKEKTHVVELLEKLIIIAENSQQEATDES